MATTLNLQETPIELVNEKLNNFFAKNYFEWKYNYEDKMLLDARHSDILPMLEMISHEVASYKGEMRGPLNIYIDHVEKANIPLKPLKQFYQTIIENEYYFGNYNLGVYACDNGLRVNMAVC